MWIRNSLIAPLVFVLGIVFALAQTITPQIGGGIGQFDGGISFSSGGGSTFPPTIGGVQPTLFADFTTEGTTNHYWFNGAQQAGVAAWNTAVGGVLTRAGNATYFQGGILKTATTGVLRFPTDLGGTPQGIRISGVGTNSVLQSNAFTTTWTLSAGGAPAQNVTGPDGTASSAWTLTAAAAAGTLLTQPVAIASPSFFSVFAKPGTSSFVYITCTDAGGAKTTWFNVSTGATGTINATTSGAPTTVQTVPSAPIQLASGWYLIGVRNTGAASTNISIGQADADNSTASTTGNTLSVFGAQGTAGGNGQLDYIPTTTVSASQIADNYLITHTFGTTSSTVLAKFTAMTLLSANVSGVYSLNDNSTANKTELSDSVGFPQTTNQSATVSETGILSIAFVNGAASKIMVAYQAGSQRLSLNGAAIRSAAPAAYPVALMRLGIGQTTIGGTFAYTNIQQIGVWDGVFANDPQLISGATLP